MLHSFALRRLSFASLLLAAAASAFSTLWTQIPLDKQVGQDVLPALEYLDEALAYRLDLGEMQGLLAQSPMEGQMFPPPAVMRIPVPDGSIQRFKVIESPILAPEIASQVPIKTYIVQGIDDKYARGRIDFGDYGFHGLIFSPHGDYIIDPIRRSDTRDYVIYYRRNSYYPRWNFRCLTPPGRWTAEEGELGIETTGPTLKTYRLALKATVEYSTYFGSVAAANAAATTSINRVTGVYENDVAIRLNIVNLVCYPPGGTDPYSNNNGSAMLGQNQTTCDADPGNANYDIGHVFSTGGGGVAGLNVVGITGQKAKGVTGSPAPVGDAFDIDYVAHEMGHQFGGRHSFNGTTSNCGGGNRDGTSAYEPGSGSTIMAYAGICGAENLQNNSDAYFHTASIDQIVSWRNNASSGGTSTNTGNGAPTVDAGPNYSIPQSTPFVLTATASDPNNDPLTYCWEQFNLGTASPTSDDTTRPLFRSWLPSTSNKRFVPRLADVLNNTNNWFEKLPAVNRSMTWRCTVRDNRALAGGVETDSMTITVTGAALTVTSPNTNVQWVAGSTQTVTWNVGGSAALSPNVNILLSTNGGTSYGTGTATVLAANVPNDGSEVITLPITTTTQARIFVEAATSIFYDVSNVNFQIVRPVISGTVILGDYVGNNSARSMTFEVRPAGSTDPVQTKVLNLNANGTYSFDFTGQTTGTYDITMKGANWLRKRRANVNITATGASSINFISVVNGDSDGDNEVTLVDFGRVSSAFGRALGDTGFDASADLNGDDEVNLFDVGIVSANFGMAGDD